MMINFRSKPTTKQLLVLLAIVTALTATVAFAVRAIDKHIASTQEANRQEALQTNLETLHEAYHKPVPETEQLHNLAPEKQASRIADAAEYYGVVAPPNVPITPLEVVGACMRDKNIELGRIYADQSNAALETYAKDLAEMRSMIAKNCYERYSPDGKVPESLTRNIHNH